MQNYDQETRIQLSVDLEKPGVQIGDIMLRWSDNRNPLGYHSSPVIKIGDDRHPAILMLAGVHGDEFEGPAALMQLAQSLRSETLAGRVIILPAFNFPAVSESSRVSPLDGENLNRAFPGHPDGGPTAMLAHFLESSIIPDCDAVIDLHSGGKASVFQPCSLVARTESIELFRRNMDLADAFDFPWVWVLGGCNDNRSVNSAAERWDVPMIAAELGGGGGVEPSIVEKTVAGLRQCMAHLNILKQMPPRQPDTSELVTVEIASHHHSLYSSGRGLFQRNFKAGQSVRKLESAGFLHFLEEPERPSAELFFPAEGIVLAHTNRGMVQRGDLLALVARGLRSSMEE